MKASFYNHQGNLKYSDGDEKEAIKYYTVAIESDPTCAYYYMNRAIAKCTLNKEDKSAKQDYLKALQLEQNITAYYHPDHFPTIEYLAYHYQTPTRYTLTPGTNVFSNKRQRIEKDIKQNKKEYYSKISMS